MLNVPQPQDRRDLDFFEVAIDGSGNAMIVYNQDRPINSPLTPGQVSCGLAGVPRVPFLGVDLPCDLEYRVPSIMFARQTSGPTIL